MIAGIVEGFYWEESDAVLGQFAEYEAGKRKALIEFMGRKGLDTYVYDPKILRGDRYERAYATESGDWRETFAVSRHSGVSFYWGLAPGGSEYWRDEMFFKVEHLLEMGAAGIALLFDDVPGGEGYDEMLRQAELACRLAKRFPVLGICPGKYAGPPAEVKKHLQPLDKNLPPSIPFILTGARVWSKCIEPEDIPVFGRGVILWDNYMAADTSVPERLELAPPDGRSKSLLDATCGYLLNPCFPVERVIPVVSAVGEMQEAELSLKQTAILPNGNEAVWYEYLDLPAIVETMSADWAEFLTTQLAPLHRLLRIRNRLDEGKMDTSEYAEVCQQWPGLEPLFELVAAEPTGARTSATAEHLADALGAMSWDGKKWEVHPLDRMHIVRKGNSLEITNTVTSHRFAKVIFPRVLTGDFKAYLAVSGDVIDVQLQAADGSDRNFYFSPTEMPDADEDRHGDSYDRFVSRVSVTRSCDRGVCFEQHGAWPRKGVRSYHGDLNMPMYVAVAVPQGGTLRVDSWTVED